MATIKKNYYYAVFLPKCDKYVACKQNSDLKSPYLYKNG